LLLNSSKRFISETEENSTTLRILHQQPTTTNTLEIVATTTQKHFAHCSDNYTTTLCTLHIAGTTLQQNFANCSNNTEDCKDNSETLRRLQRKLHTTPLLKNAITNLKRVACNNVSDHNLHNE
jgi:hypothetical protein